MRSLVLVKVAWQSILKNTMRTLLTMLGIIIGVGAVIVMVAVGLGAKERINQQIQNLGTNMIVLTAGLIDPGRRQPGSAELQPPHRRQRRGAAAGEHAADGDLARDLHRRPRPGRRRQLAHDHERRRRSTTRSFATGR